VIHYLEAEPMLVEEPEPEPAYAAPASRSRRDHAMPPPTRHSPHVLASVDLWARPAARAQRLLPIAAAAVVRSPVIKEEFKEWETKEEEQPDVSEEEARLLQSMGWEGSASEMPPQKPPSPKLKPAWKPPKKG
jgi:hypothetical protein